LLISLIPALLSLVDDILMMMRQSSGEERVNRRIMQPVAEEKTPYSTLSRAAAKESLLAQAKAEAKSPSSSYEGSTGADSKPTSTKGKSPGKGKKPLKRRNSTGTIFIETTMSAQDNNATIQCVCVVIRAHMISAAKENIIPLPEYDTFTDYYFLNTMSREDREKNPIDLVPTLQTVKEFFTLIFSKSQLESDCIIMALIYCERLVKETKGKLAIRYDNWRSM
jgi:hypothetical protein